MELMKDYINSAGRILTHMIHIDPESIPKGGKPMWMWCGLYSTGGGLWSKIKIIMKHGTRS
mgnify:CR=1 FL=1